MTNPFRLLQTHLLFQEIDKPLRDYPPGRSHLRDERVAGYLALGADPWGRGSRNRQVLGAIGTATPGELAVNAWFRAAGRMDSAPWERSGAEHPLLTIVRGVHQPDKFCERLFLRALDAGAPIMTEQTKDTLLEEVFHKFDPPVSTHLIERLLTDCQELVDHPATQAFLIDKETWLGSITARFATPQSRCTSTFKP